MATARVSLRSKVNQAATPIDARVNPTSALREKRPRAAASAISAIVPPAARANAGPTARHANSGVSKTGI
jgi:hypothetical protein